MNVLTDEICGADPEPEEDGQNPQDLPPEYCQYKDEGCEYALSCLNCPFSRCMHDAPGGRKRWLKELRDREIYRLHKEGHKARELMDIFDVSERTVHRAIDSCRNPGKTKRRSNEKKCPIGKIDT